RGEASGQLARVDFDEVLPALHRQAHTRAVLVDRLRFGGKAHEPYRVSSEQQLCREERTLRPPPNQHFVSHVTHSLCRTEKLEAPLVSRFRSSPEFAARSEANFGIEGH